MPKFGAHLIFAELAAEKRPDLFANNHCNAMRLGAVGPDLTLFILDPSIRQPELRRGFESALGILETIQDLADKFRSIQEILSEPVENLSDYLSGGMTRDFSYTINIAIEAITSAMKLGITNAANVIAVANPIFNQLNKLPGDFIRDPAFSADTWRISVPDVSGFPFRMFGHPLTDDPPWKRPSATGDYSEWWWMDLLHYRKTGDFAQTLISQAASPLQKSYARGYVTHVAGDITGHPFINSLVHGPFRNHAYRHLVLETISDTWLWRHVGRGDILDARLDRLIDVSSSQAEEIANLVIRSMEVVYRPPMVPNLLSGGYPSNYEFLGAYKLLKQYLRLSTSGSLKRPAPPPDSFQEVWDEISGLIQATLPGHPPVWNGDVVDFLAAVLAWFGKGLVLLVMIVTLPVAIITRLLAIAPRWVIYLINLALYNLASGIRVMLALTGWGYLGAEDFESFGFLENMVKTSDVEQGTYPASPVPNPKPPFYWLSMPRWPWGIEQEPISPIKPWMRGMAPDWMIHPKNQLDQNALALLSSASPNDTRVISNLIQGGLGNAVDFSVMLLDRKFPIPNLDLDGDRGYGFREWEILPPNEIYI